MINLNYINSYNKSKLRKSFCREQEWENVEFYYSIKYKTNEILEQFILKIILTV